MSSKTTTTTEPISWAHMFSIARLSCGHLVLVPRVQDDDDARACPVCYAEACAKAESGAAAIAILVRKVHGDIRRARAIEHLTSWDLSVHDHVMRSHAARVAGPSTLADTQELEVLS